MKNLFFAILTLLFAGCTVDWIHEFEHIFINETDYSIQIKGYKHGTSDGDENLLINLHIPKGESVSYLGGFAGGIDYLMLGYNLTVIFDETTTIRHNTPTGELLPVERNLSLFSSYKIIDSKSTSYPFKRPDREYVCGEYTFTEVDYLEALETL
jgi:hypothetical protein